MESYWTVINIGIMNFEIGNWKLEISIIDFNGDKEN